MASWGWAVMEVLLVVIAVVSMHTRIVDGTRVLYASATDGLMPRFFERLAPTHAPTWPLLLQVTGPIVDTHTAQIDAFVAQLAQTAKPIDSQPCPNMLCSHRCGLAVSGWQTWLMSAASAVGLMSGLLRVVCSWCSPS